MKVNDKSSVVLSIAGVPIEVGKTYSFIEYDRYYCGGWITKTTEGKVTSVDYNSGKITIDASSKFNSSILTLRACYIDKVGNYEME